MISTACRILTPILAQSVSFNAREALVSSIRVHRGIENKGDLQSIRGTSRKGASKVTPSASSFLQNASSPFTSKPM